MSLGSSNLKRTEMQEEAVSGMRLSKTPFIAAAIILIALLVAGILPRLKRSAEIGAAAKQQAKALVQVDAIAPHPGQATSELLLPATTQAIQETLVAARTSGYVRRWHADLGQKVRVGQLLAEIDVPETNQLLKEAQRQADEANQVVLQGRAELAQAQAGLEQAQASLKQTRTNLELARINIERSKTLVSQGVVSRQDTDDKQAVYDARLADYEAAQATVKSRQSAIKAQQSLNDARISSSGAHEANARKFADIKSFQRVVAPYDGTITARYVEAGTLITATGGTANNAGLFRIAKLGTIRVFVNVPQSFAPSIHPGLEVRVEVKELAPSVFAGKVVATSNSIDPVSRSMVVEIRVPNKDGKFLPGMYAQARFTIPRSDNGFLIPAGALVTNAEGTQVIIVKPDQTAHYQVVEVGRDFGKELEILSGLNGNETIVTTPSDELREGVKVEVRKPRK